MRTGRFEVPPQATKDEGQAAGACRILATAVGIAVASLAFAPAPAGAATTCSYDSTSDILSVGGDPERGTRLEISNSDGILVYHLAGGSIGLVGCAGSPPTTTNTDAIEVTHSQPGDSDTISVVGPEEFAPGVTDEQFGIFDLADEIEITLDLGGGQDQLSLQPGDTNDARVVLGVEGVNWNAGDIVDDADIVTDDFPSISSYDVFLGNGENNFTAQGGLGTGAAITAPLTLLGGDFIGRDRLTGGEGPDLIDGLGRRDVLRGAGGNDDLTGSAGADRLIGGAGHDRLFAKDGKRDRKIDCGPGAADGATRDGKDPQPISC